MKASFPNLAACLVSTALCALSGEGIAAPCAGFTDVDDTDPLVGTLFCQNVEWIKNRKVTAGCTGTTYCPHNPVSRLQMAAFMNQLGKALTPEIVRLDAASGAANLSLLPVVCQSVAQTIIDFPRRVQVDATFSGTAGGGVDVAMRVVWSPDGGATWLPLSASQSVTFVPAAQWSSASDFGTLDLPVGASARFGVQLSRNGPGSVNLTDSRCQLRASIGSRDGASSPF